jgi:hypothetical protein
LQQPANHHLAELNIGRIKHDLDDPRTADFTNNLELVNGLAEHWFEHFEGPAVALWWVPAGHRPTMDEALARLAHLKAHGPDDCAFDWKTAAAQLWKTARCAPSGQVA